MSDLEWWVFEGQDWFRIEPNTPHYADRTSVWLIEHRDRGFKWVDEFDTVEDAVHAARGVA